MSEPAQKVVCLVRTLVCELVDNPDAVELKTTPLQEDKYLIELSVDQDDIGKVIGRKGRLIKAIRTLARACASQDHLRVELELAAD